MRIAVMDDEEQFAGVLVSFIQQYYREKKIAVDVVKFTFEGNLLVQLEDNSNFDVYFLDIEMPNTNGMELAEKIRMQDKYAIIIFLTFHAQYAIQGYRYQAYSYIMKSDWRVRLPEILEKISMIYADRQTVYYEIHNSIRHEKFPIGDILYLEKEKKYTIFHCRQKEYHERETLEKVHKKLEEVSQGHFIYINQGQIINLSYLSGQQQQSVILQDKTRLFISRNMLPNVKSQILEYWRKR